MTELLSRATRRGALRDPAALLWAARNYDVSAIVEHLCAALLVAQGTAEHLPDATLRLDGVDPRIKDQYADLAARLDDLLAWAEMLERSRADYRLLDADDQLTRHGREILGELA